jgi:mono/diheme cytochrome c family protein
METVLHQRGVQRLSSRRRAYGAGLDHSDDPHGVDPRQRGRAAGGIAIAVAWLATVWIQPAAAQNLKNGEALLTRNCAACHAVGRNGESPHKSAPPFRTLGKRYPIESLEEALGEGIMSGHPDMPEFSFDAGEVGDIIAYLKSIQQR